MKHTALHAAALAALAAAAAPAQASNCDEIRAGIEAKVRAAGVAAFTLTVVDIAANAPGREVGRCDRGSKKILYVAEGKAAPVAPPPPAPAAPPPPAPAAPPPPAPQRPAAVLTECKDGSVTQSDCTKR